MSSSFKHESMRIIAGALVVVALAAQLGGVAHLVAVRHVTCAEHGELIEVRSERAVLAGVTRAARDAVAAEAAGETHGHDHCLLAAMRRNRTLAGGPVVSGCARVDAFGTIGRPINRDLTPPIALLRNAPKSSPPRA